MSPAVPADNAHPVGRQPTLMGPNRGSMRWDDELAVNAEPKH